MVKLIWQDYLLGLGVALNLGARLATGFIQNSLSGLVQTTNTLESNPTSRTTITTSYFVTFAVSMVMYAGLLCFYMYMRKGRDKSEYNKIAFSFFTLLCAFAFASDFINDFAIVLALVLK